MAISSSSSNSKINPGIIDVSPGLIISSSVSSKPIASSSSSNLTTDTETIVSSSSSSKQVSSRPVSNPVVKSSSSSSNISGPVSVASQPNYTSQVPLAPGISAPTASGTNISNIELIELSRSNMSVSKSNELSNLRLNARAGINSSSLVKLDFVNIFYNKNFPSDANHAELFYPSKDSNPYFVLSSKSLPEEIKLDIISFSEIPLQFDDKKYSGNFVFSENPFSVKISDGFSISNKEKYENDIVKFFDFNRNKSIINIKLQDIYKYVGRLFPFEIKINFVDSAVSSVSKDLNFSVIEPILSEVALQTFDNLSCGVQKSSDNTFGNFFYIREMYKFIPETLMSIQGSEFYDCNNSARNLLITDSKQENQDGIVSSVDIKFNFQEIIPYAFPLFYIKDREEVHFNKPSLKYNGSNFALYSDIKHISYNIGNQLFFYDQIINRYVASRNSDGSLLSKNHSIFYIKDVLDSLRFNYGLSDDGIFEKNNLEFRREYLPDELTSVLERNDYDANYFMYINATNVSASNRMTPIGEFVINKKIKDPVSCKIGYFIEKEDNKIKDNFNIKLYSITSVGSSLSPRVFSRSLTVKWSNSPSFPYGKYYTYGSGKNADNGYELQCLTIKDIVEIFSNNIAGDVNENTPKGESSSICNGLFPTLNEINPNEYSDYDPVVSFYKNENYSGFYLFPISRMWIGNSDNSTAIAKSESDFISLSNENNSTQRKKLYCLGVEKNIDLSKFCIAMPLSRKVGRLKVRHEIKTFEEHLMDGDFNTRARGGKSDSRFYKYNTIKDSVDILREGFSYFYATVRVNSSELPHYYGRISGNDKEAMGSQKKLIGLAQIGVISPYHSMDPLNGDDFHNNSPSYLLSGFSGDDPLNISDKYILKYVNNFSNYLKKIEVVYRNKEMLPQRTSSFYPIDSHLSNFSATEFYPYGGEKYGSNPTIFMSTGSDDGYTRKSERLSRDYIPGSSYLLDLKNHDKDKQSIIEGGDVSSSSRNVGISACYDTKSLEYGMVPNSDFIRNELISLAQANGSSRGNISSSTKSKNNGFCNVNGTGDLNNQFQISIQPNYLLLNKNGEIKKYENEVRSFVDILRDQLGDRSSIKISSNYSLNDKIPPEYLSLEYRYLIPFVSSSSSTSSIDFEVPDEYDAYDAYGYSNNYVVPFDEYGNYDFFDAYNPYENVIEPNINIRNLGFANINQRQITSLKILTKKQINKTYKFPLKPRSSYSLADLIIDVNKSMSPLGVSFRSLINNPGRFSSIKLVEDEKTILDTELAYVTDLYEEEVIVPADRDPYFSIDPYNQFNTIKYLKKQRSKQKQKTLYEVKIDGLVQAAIESESVYSARVKISPFEKSSGLSPMSDNTIVYESNIYLSRPRYNSTVNALLENQNLQQSLEPLNVDKSPLNDQTLLFPNFEEKGRIDNVESSVKDDSLLFNNIQKEQAIAGSSPNLKAMQFSYAGSISNGQNSFNNPPNTFFENGTNIFGEIEFNTNESDYVLIAVRFRLNDAPFLYPEQNDTAGFDNLKNNIICRVEYSTGEAIEVLTPVSDLDINSDLFVQEELDDLGQPIYIRPVIFKIPLKGLISYITFYYSQFNVVVASGFVKVLNAPNELDQFGFLAINNTNSRFSMNSSKISKTFGLVLDNVGSWDVLISPEASLSRALYGDFDLPSGISFSRTVIDTEERFILGIGDPIINADNDITGFDTSMIPPQVLSNISLLPVPNYQQVWILKIQSGLKSYLASIRNSAGPNSLEGCYVDIPIFARGMISGSEGTASIRIFYSVDCVFDYTFCEFFWNLGSPLLAPGAKKIINDLSIRYEELIDCTRIAERIPGVNDIKLYNYSIVNIDKLPMLDNGTSLLLLKSQSNLGYISNIFWPSTETMGNLSKIPLTPPANETPWDYDCQPLGPSEIAIFNKTIMYTNPNDLSIYETNLVQINQLLKTSNSYMLIQPRINFPPEDDGDKNYANEKIIGSAGFVFKNWRSNSNWTFTYSMLFGFEAIASAGSTNLDIFVPMTYKYYYNEDRQKL